MADHWKWKKGQKPKTLESKDLAGLAKYIQSEKCKNIVLMVRLKALLCLKLSLLKLIAC
jgi:hypothetical protein